MKNESKPAYYSILPANVRYCPDLSFFEKVLYSEITALSNAYGFCWASNSYFAKLYRKDSFTISKAISKLQNNGFIACQVDKEIGNVRRVYIVDFNAMSEYDNTPIVENDNSPIVKNTNSPIVKNTKYNTTSNNNTREVNKPFGLAELFASVFEGKEISIDQKQEALKQVEKIKIENRAFKRSLKNANG